jgi:hypothetical protein
VDVVPEEDQAGWAVIEQPVRVELVSVLRAGIKCLIEWISLATRRNVPSAALK